MEHKFEFIDIDTSREFLGAVLVHDYEVVVDGSVTIGRSDLWELDRECAKQADAAAIRQHEEKESLEASQREDYHAWRRS